MRYLVFFILIMTMNNVFSQSVDLKYQKFSRIYYIKKNVFESMPNSEDEIIFLGNSITAGVEWSELLNNADVKNRGISGDVTEGILFRLNEITESGPSKIFLMIGINDLANGLSNDSILENYDTILKRILKDTPESEIYVQSILPVNNDYDYFKKLVGKSDSILIVNEGLQRLAKKYDLDYIDLFSSFVNEEGKLKKEYTFDGLHLNGKAYLKWKELIEGFLN